jgi:hypothetical protein
MNIEELKQKPLWQMTGDEFLFLQQNTGQKEIQSSPLVDNSKKYVYGLKGLKTLFNCSIATANRIKASGRIEKAISQVGRKIIIDADLALELAGRKNGGRR